MKSIGELKTTNGTVSQTPEQLQERIIALEKFNKILNNDNLLLRESLTNLALEFASFKEDLKDELKIQDELEELKSK